MTTRDTNDDSRFLIMQGQCAARDCEKPNHPRNFRYVQTPIGICAIYLCDECWMAMQEARTAELERLKEAEKPRAVIADLMKNLRELGDRHEPL